MFPHMPSTQWPAEFFTDSIIFVAGFGFGLEQAYSMARNSYWCQKISILWSLLLKTHWFFLIQILEHRNKNRVAQGILFKSFTIVRNFKFLIIQFRRSIEKKSWGRKMGHLSQTYLALMQSLRTWMRDSGMVWQKGQFGFSSILLVCRDSFVVMPFHRQAQRKFWILGWKGVIHTLSQY